MRVIGHRLREVRESANRSQEDVAAKAGISREYLSMVERGTSSPTVDKLQAICKALGIAAWTVLRDVEERLQDRRS